jgi:hypothetical protein
MGFFIQGHNGNFEVVVPRVGGGADHLWRDNAAPGEPWHGPAIAFGSMGDMTATALLQSTFGGGNLEVLCTEGDKLVHLWRASTGFQRWQNRTFLPGTVLAGGAPAMVQSAAGDLEVVAPLPGGGMGHWYRDTTGWQGPTGFGTGPVAAAALALGPGGNLEVVTRAGAQLQHWWRDGLKTWHPGAVVGTGAAGQHDLVVADDGSLQVLAPLAAGGFGHWSRADDPPAFPWSGPAVFGASVVAVGAASLVQHANGNLEAVVRAGAHLEHWWRAGSGSWQGPTAFGQRPVLDPAVHGECVLAFDTGVVAVHAAVLKTGQVMMFGFTDFSDGVGDGRLLDPATGALQTPGNASHHLFCSGHAVAPDGRLVAAGGHHDEVTAVHAPNPDAGNWLSVGHMTAGRWYPTCTTLPDGTVLATSGTMIAGPTSPGNPVNNTLQVVDPGGPQATRAVPTPFSVDFPPALPTIDLYPFVFVLPSGHLLVHSRHVTRFYDPAADSWSATQLATTSPFSRTYPGEGSAVLLALRPGDGHRARVLLVGGGGDHPEALGADTPATATAEVLDLGEPSPAWRPVAPMAFARIMPDAVLLPDGTVAVVGGSSTGRADHAIDPVLPVELFDPASGTFATACSIHAARLYHSTALLLPDATVLIAGKDGVFNPEPYHYPERRGEVFRPPYLFRGGPRPTISWAPDKIGWATPFHVDTPDAAAVATVVLVRPGSVTHSFNMDQRLVELEVTGRTGGAVALVGPPDANVAPPGHYMLFLLDDRGVPSVARFVHL